MPQSDPIPTVILVPKPEKTRRKSFAEQIPWAKVAIGGSLVWLLLVGILTWYFARKDGPARSDEQALNALPGGRPLEREQPEKPDKKPAPVVKPEVLEEDFEAPPGKEEFVDCDRIGVSVKFMKEPTEAFLRAKAEKKMVFMVHLSGNLEDPQFT